MARIPDDQIDRLKQEVSLQRLAQGMGITLKQKKRDNHFLYQSNTAT